MIFFIAIVMICIIRFWPTLFVIIVNMPRDTICLLIALQVKFHVFKMYWKNMTVTQVFMQNVRKHPDKVAIYYQDEKWSFQQLDQFSNQVTNYFTQLGFNAGDEVALFMENRPEFIGLWLGLAKMGIVTAFINTNNRNECLMHALTVVRCKAVIFDTHLQKYIEEIYETMKQKEPTLQYFHYGDNFRSDSCVPSKPLCQLLSGCAKDYLIAESYIGNFNDKLCYIFTSGTTGLPKAANIPNLRFITIEAVLHYSFRMRSSDNLYISIPLYHSLGGVVGVGHLLIFGGTITIRKKFSASHFWKDCIQNKCTVAFYIGEICRYLLSQPVTPHERNHQLRMMLGNGLRAKIWREFQQRFVITKIGEFYGSSEGNIATCNVTGYEGSCGILPYYWSIFLRILYPLSIIKVDPLTGQHVRNSKGLCRRIKPGEVGEIVGKIIDYDPTLKFSGYVSSNENKKKIIENVHRKGDRAFLSGDYMQMDSNGYLYFKDRTGDTFRWKGENVSTNEVEAIIQKVTQFSDCVVFGVSVGQYEGKAGMAVLAGDHCNIQLNQLALNLQQQLPSYAVPLFIRFVNSIDMTGTFKFNKNYLRELGYKPNNNKSDGNIYFLDKKTNCFIPLDDYLYDQIQSGQIPL